MSETRSAPGRSQMVFANGSQGSGRSRNLPEPFETVPTSRTPSGMQSPVPAHRRWASIRETGSRVAGHLLARVQLARASKTSYTKKAGQKIPCRIDEVFPEQVRLLPVVTSAPNPGGHRSRLRLLHLPCCHPSSAISRSDRASVPNGDGSTQGEGTAFSESNDPTGSLRASCEEQHAHRSNLGRAPSVAGLADAAVGTGSSMSPPCIRAVPTCPGAARMTAGSIAGGTVSVRTCPRPDQHASVHLEVYAGVLREP